MTKAHFAIFLCTFFSVFLLGLQSKNVNQGRYTAAIITSFGISVAQFAFVKYAVAGSYYAFAFSAVGGCFGITFSIWFYKHIIERNQHGKKYTKRSIEKGPQKDEGNDPGSSGKGTQ
ncbi:hypothetical protein [Ferrovum sp.]|uniref:hypothetical protein n=1 Tax=Ferrovum sp. TaxID=2609467 RepID=UPI00260B466E|nr:hypothetical protein [Ferrovum sp.]